MAARGGGESTLIDAFCKPFGARAGAAGGLIVGPGSDCAVLQPSRGMRLVATTDAAVEGVHFDLRHFAPEDVGHKALAMNLSDLAAAGARPRWFLCALAVPAGRSGAIALAVRMARGMAALARRHRVLLAGGNVTSAAQWSITITALGEARKPLTRAGGRPGDLLLLVGELGAAARGLRELRDGALRAGARAQLRPAPLMDAGLVATGLASASIDVSDGLLADLAHLCQASGCGATVEAGALPIAPRATLDEALAGGEDYALLFAVPPRKSAALMRALERAEPASAVRAIGRLDQRAGIRLLRDGAPLPLPARRGWDHLVGA